MGSASAGGAGLISVFVFTDHFKSLLFQAYSTLLLLGGLPSATSIFSSTVNELPSSDSETIFNIDSLLMKGCLVNSLISKISSGE